MDNIGPTNRSTSAEELAVLRDVSSSQSSSQSNSRAPGLPSPPHMPPRALSVTRFSSNEPQASPIPTVGGNLNLNNMALLAAAIAVALFSTYRGIYTLMGEHEESHLVTRTYFMVTAFGNLAITAMLVRSPNLRLHLEALIMRDVIPDNARHTGLVTLLISVGLIAQIGYLILRRF